MWHRRLVEGCSDMDYFRIDSMYWGCRECWWDDLQNRGYLLANTCGHLVNACIENEPVTLVSRLGWKSKTAPNWSDTKVRKRFLVCLWCLA